MLASIYLMAKNKITPPKTVAIYIHWPFCLSLCPYCDFNSHVKENVNHHDWKKALILELEHYSKIIGARKVTSIFFGGGTPSLMEADTVAKIIETVAKYFSLVKDVEITLEANPTSSESKTLSSFSKAGINRVSLGVQALDDESLILLGRKHNTEEAKRAIKLASDSFERFSFDLIYARPKQTKTMWEKELKEATRLARGHLSVYQLIIEPGTPFYLSQARGLITLPNESLSVALFQMTQEILESVNLPSYEVSNHAAVGEYCKQNMTYWHYGDYIGIGPGAHGRITLNGNIYATRQHRAPEMWLKRTEMAGHATQTFVPLDEEEIINEIILMGLRTKAGVDASNFYLRTGRNLKEAVNVEALNRLKEGNFLTSDQKGIRTTMAGLLRLNSVIKELVSF